MLTTLVLHITGVGVSAIKYEACDVWERAHSDEPNSALSAGLMNVWGGCWGGEIRCNQVKSGEIG
jgi:hypothetical protein